MTASFLALALCLVLVKAEDNSLNASDIAIAVGGIGLFLFAAAVYASQKCKRKNVVEFQSFEMSNPTPVSVMSQQKGKELTTFSTEAIKEPQFQAGLTSPAEHKKRKRKAHRLSDRRRNQQAQQDSVQVEQESQL